MRELIQRMKEMPLWKWGLIVIFSGLMTNMTMMLSIQSSDMRRSQERAATMGASVAAILFILVGIGLIVTHFLRKKR